MDSSITPFGRYRTSVISSLSLKRTNKDLFSLIQCYNFVKTRHENKYYKSWKFQRFDSK